MPQRLVSLDLYRGVGVILMVLFHLSYDLHYFGFSPIDTTRHLFWVSFRVVIVAIFMSAVGMSLTLVYSRGFALQKYLRRIGYLALAAGLVTAVTYVVFPYSWVYFGVLHMILVAAILGPFFVKLPRLSAFLGVGLILLYVLGYRMTPLFELLQPLLHLPRRHTEDLAPFIPWFGAVLLGITMMHYRLMERLSPQETPTVKKITFLGRHSLAIYLLHQPLLFGIIGGIAWLMGHRF